MSDFIKDLQKKKKNNTMEKVCELYKKISIHYKIWNIQFYIQSLQPTEN